MSCLMVKNLIFGSAFVSMSAFWYLKHPIKLRYYVGLTIVPSVVFVNLVPGSIGINVSLQSIIPASFRILHTYADCLIEMSLLFCVTSIPR
nr:hypothetical protein [Tanacetum cinerariifolium]